VEKAFPAYEKATELNPFEPVYRYNLATVIFLFRKDAQAYYHIDEQAVFGKALDMYREVRRLRPNKFRYAFDFAQTFYGVKLPPTKTPEEKQMAELRLADAALAAWDDALAVSDNDVDREGIFVHRARWHLKVGRLEAARTNLLVVTNEVHLETRRRIERNIAAAATNTPSAR
jgi:tetratricopeptide (TPR) repeat protein